MMAQKYGKYPHVIYEIYNEPMEDTWESVKEYATDIITQIRKYDPDNIILVGSPHWDQDLHLVAADPLQGFNNIMYTLHFYAATHKQELRDRATAAWEQGIPIFVSECAGMECTGDGPLDIEEWTRWVEWMEAHKISWVNWSISDKNETCSMLLPRADKNGGWDESLIKPAGRQSRKFIRQYNEAVYRTIEYCPSTLVIVPLPFEFNSVTLAPGIGKPESSATTPFTTMSAIAVVAQNTATTNDIALSILPTI